VTAPPEGPFPAARGLVPRFDAQLLAPAAVLTALASLSTPAELAAVAMREDGGAAGAEDAGDRRAVLLLAETARALHALVSAPGARPGDGPDVERPARAPAGGARGRGGDRRPSAAVVRVARMEQWLTARAEHDHAAQPAADLCLWVLEHLDHDP
jgi:hypothetical protein